MDNKINNFNNSKHLKLVFMISMVQEEDNNNNNMEEDPIKKLILS